MKYFVGIDPGFSGGLAVLDECGKVVLLEKFKDCTERDLLEMFLRIPEESFLLIEKVGAMPKQGVASTFQFGFHYGCLVGLAAARGLPYDFVRPQVWQKALGCLTKGDKNITKAAAQRLFPQQNITHAVADALLIAEYNRRTCGNSFQIK